METAEWSQVWQAAERERARHGWSKAELYRRAQISEPTYAAMRDGVAIVRPDKRHAFAAALGWTVEDLDAIAAGRPAPSGAVPPAPGGDEVAALRAELADLRAQVQLMAELVGRLIEA